MNPPDRPRAPDVGHVRRRSAIVGHGRLLPMTGPRVGSTDVIEGPWVAVLADGRVAEVRAGGLRPGDPDDVDDVGGALVTPGLVDPHTHLVFAGDRSDEAAARSRGERYSGGGILRTVRATAAASDEDLVAATRARLLAAAASGTTTIEVKSGYGLTAAAELRLLRLIAEAAAPAAPARAADVPGRPRRARGVARPASTPKRSSRRCRTSPRRPTSSTSSASPASSTWS